MAREGRDEKELRRRFLGILGGSIYKCHELQIGDPIAFIGEQGCIVEGEILGVSRNRRPNLILYRSLDRISIGTLCLDRRAVYKILERFKMKEVAI